MATPKDGLHGAVKGWKTSRFPLLQRNSKFRAFFASHFLPHWRNTLHGHGRVQVVHFEKKCVEMNLVPKEQSKENKKLATALQNAFKLLGFLEGPLQGLGDCRTRNDSLLAMGKNVRRVAEVFQRGKRRLESEMLSQVHRVHQVQRRTDHVFAAQFIHGDGRPSQIGVRKRIRKNQPVLCLSGNPKKKISWSKVPKQKL